MTVNIYNYQSHYCKQCRYDTKTKDTVPKQRCGIMLHPMYNKELCIKLIGVKKRGRPRKNKSEAN